MLKICLSLIEDNTLIYIIGKCGFIQSYYVIIASSYLIQIKNLIKREFALGFKKSDIIS